MRSPPIAAQSLILHHFSLLCLGLDMDMDRVYCRSCVLAKQLPGEAANRTVHVQPVTPASPLLCPTQRDIVEVDVESGKVTRVLATTPEEHGIGELATSSSGPPLLQRRAPPALRPAPPPCRACLAPAATSERFGSLIKASALLATHKRLKVLRIPHNCLPQSAAWRMVKMVDSDRSLLCNSPPPTTPPPPHPPPPHPPHPPTHPPHPPNSLPRSQLPLQRRQGVPPGLAAGWPHALQMARRQPWAPLRPAPGQQVGRCPICQASVRTGRLWQPLAYMYVLPKAVPWQACRLREAGGQTAGLGVAAPRRRWLRPSGRPQHASSAGRWSS